MKTTCGIILALALTGFAAAAPVREPAAAAT